MATQYLVSVENLKKQGLIHQNSDTKILAVAIKRVQEMNIQPATGSPLFRALLVRVASGVEFYLERLIGFLRDDCGTKYPEYNEAITRTNHDMKKIKTGYRINWTA